MDYNELDPEEFRDLTQAAGSTLVVSQSFENGMKLILYCLCEKKIIDFSLEKALEIIEYRQRKTLGQIFGVVKHKLNVNESDLGVLNDAVERRNYFIHSIIHENITRIINPSSRIDVITEILEIRSLLLTADRITANIIQELLNLFDINFQKLTENLNKEIALINKKK